jgi:hypothetical protein
VRDAVENQTPAKVRRTYYLGRLANP